MVKRPGRLERFFQRLSKIEPEELLPSALSFLMVLILMCSYYILRPYRDALASDWSDAELSFIWTLNFFLSVAVVSLYGWVVTWVRFNWLVPSVYASFVLIFALFYIAMTEVPAPHITLDKGFYLWMSIFSLFNISLFWSFMSDLFTERQARRLFPVIGAGASAGALLGPAVPTLLVEWLGTDNLILSAAVLLAAAIPLTFILRGLKATALSDRDQAADRARIGGNPFAGFRDFFTNPYLLCIGLFIILYTAIGSIVYFEQKNLLASYELIDRTKILGAVDWIVNILSFTVAFFVTGRLVLYFGMPAALSMIPFAMCAGLSALTIFPMLMVVLVLQIARRAGNYAITRPAREMLFTLVSREDRFKAKPVIDIVAYRGGDMVTSWGFAALTHGLGFGLGAMAAVGAGIAAIWGSIALYLGRWFERTSSKDIEI